MAKLKRKKKFAILGILLLFFVISGIFVISKYDKYSGLINIKSSEIKLLSDVSLSSNIKGTDELTYQVRYTLDEITGVDKRDVVIKGTLNSNYARFKPIADTNTTSVVSNDGKSITINISNVPLGEEQIINFKINVVNAPNGEEIKPIIEIKESTGDYTRLSTDTIRVETNSISGSVYDENELKVNNIELSLYKDNTEIKRTYTNNNGDFIFTDLEEGNYKVKVEEDIYELISDSSSSELNDSLILHVREIDNFNIEIHKYISNLKLIVDGKEENYSYDDTDKIVKTIKKFNDISGEIEYKIVVKNNSDKQTQIKDVVDELQDGLSFDETKNPGWSFEDGKMKYLPIENVLFEPYEKREINITLDITNTKELKTYINKLKTKGEVNERVIFILDGNEIRNFTVLEGNKITKPEIGVDVTWYTDRNRTNEYNFDNPVNKNLILYASTEVVKYNVTFKDEDLIINTVEVNENEKVDKPTDPVKTGYTFKCWTLNDVCYNFDNIVESDITLESSYTIDNYNITYNGLTEEELSTLNNVKKYTVETDSFSILNPNSRKDASGYNIEDFLGWDDGSGNVSMHITIEKGSTGDRTYTAIWKDNEDDYSITYDLNGGDLSDENPSTYKRNTDAFTLNNPSKRGYTFTGWTGSNGFAPEEIVTIEKGSSGNKYFNANYQLFNYTISYLGLTNEELILLNNPITYNVESDSITLNKPSRIGYTFTGWSLNDSTEKVMDVRIPTGSIDNRTYTANFDINKYKVTYMDQNSKFYEEEVDYNTQATGITEIPTKPHNIFLGWYLNDNIFDFNTLVTEDITLESKYEEVEEPVITYTPDSWTSSGITISINSDHDDYTYMYKIGDGNYQEYVEPFNINENTTIYAYSVKNNIVSTESRITIDNIDRINPNITLMEFDSVTPVSASLNMKMIDEESGLNKYNIYIDDVLVFESASYTTDITEEKTETYSINNLEELSTYIVKLEVFDVSGNVSEREMTLETPPKHYVARILNYEKEEIERYESLKEAIESDNCALNCYIEMLDDVNEKNDISIDQNIVLDLNGKTITGTNDYTFYNNGNLKIVDYNEDANGKITSNGITIINKNKLQIGENEEELNVSLTEPIIEGNQYGVQNNGTLNYYDGTIIGETPVDGVINDTPFLYNAILGSTGTKMDYTLQKVADAVARLNSVYYTNAQSAVDESANGYLDEVDYTRPLIEQLQSNDSYRIVYDEVSNTAINDNRSYNNTLAHSYIKLDLTNYDDNQMLYVNADINGGSGDYGYATITESIETPQYNDTNGRFIYLSGSKEAQDYKTILEKGKIYYLHIGYKKDSFNYSEGKDIFRINKISLGNFNAVPLSNLDNVFLYNDPNYYFEKDTNGYLVSNNNGIPSTTAHSYFVVDLTNVDENKYLFVKAKISSQSVDYGYITVNNSFDMPARNATGQQLYISGEQSEKQYIIELTKNKINFVHLCYYKNNSTDSGEDKFTITSIKPISNEQGDITDGKFVNNGDYYFEKLKVIDDLSNNDNYAIPTGITKNDSGNGFVFNGNDTILKMENIITSNTLSQESVILNINPTTRDNQLIYMGSSYEKIGFGIYNNYLIVSVGSNKANTYPIPDDFTDGTDKKVVITYSNGEYKLYYNNTLLTSQSTLDSWTGGLNNYTYIGGRSNGNPYTGILYNVKTFNRTLTEEEILGTPSDEGLILYVDASTDLVEKEAYVNNNPGITSTTASSYMLFDLTNSSDDMLLQAKVTTSSRSYNYAYITVKDTSTAPAYNDTDGRYYFSNNGAGSSTVNIKLTAGKLNYVHFGFNDNQPKSSDYTETFIINNLKLLRDDLQTNIMGVDYISTKVEDFSSTENIPVLNQDPEKVELIKNVTLSKPLEIINTRDVILDLNGKTLSTASSDYVIKNEGSLKIIDSEFETNKTINDDYIESQASLFEEAKQKYLDDLTEYEEYAGLCDGCELSDEYKIDHIEEYLIDYDLTPVEYTFDYTGEEEELYLSDGGLLKLETWGAQGGTFNATYQGGFGSYSTGKYVAESNETLYINVGGQGGYAEGQNNEIAQGGYNGGGSGVTAGPGYYRYSTGGGGATHIATKSGLLNSLEDDKNSILIVSGGGSGLWRVSTTGTSNWETKVVGQGGGMKGLNGEGTNGNSTRQIGKGGSQEEGFAFGQGASANGAGPGAGGGYYGGYLNTYGAGGGSGYIGNESLYDKKMTMYSTSEDYISTEKSTKTEITTNVSDNPISEYAKKGNGYAKITLIVTGEKLNELKENLPKTYSVKSKPIFKDYLSDIDFDDSVNVDEIVVDSTPSYNKKVAENVNGNISSTTYSVILNDYDAYLNIQEGNVVLDIAGNYDGITNKGKLTLGDNSYVKAMKSNNKAIYNNQSGDILDGSGNISTAGSTSYGIYNDSLVDTNIKGYNINSLVGSSYNIFNQSYNDLVLDSINTGGQGIDIYQNTDSNLTIKNSTLGSEGNESFYSNESSIPSTITINNSNILNRINNRSKRKIIINDSNMTIGNKNGNIYNTNGEITLNNTDIINQSFDNYSTYYSIDNRSILYINGGSINDIPHSRGTFYAIYNTGLANITGNLEINPNFNYGVYNVGTINLGVNDDVVSDTYPLINGKTTAIYNSLNSTYNYYDGKLVGPINYTLDGIVSDSPADYDLNVSQEDNKEIITLKSYDKMLSDQEYVAAIGNDKYVSLDAAINAANENEETEITILRNINTVKYNIIPENKNIKINQNGNSIRSYNNDSCFINNGFFSLFDNTNPIYENISYSYFIKNNGIANYDNVTTKTLSTNDIITNNLEATMTIDSGKIYSNSTRLINNSGEMIINGGKIYTLSKPSSVYTEACIIENFSTGSLKVNGGEYKLDTQGSVIKNSGNLEVTDATVNLTDYTNFNGTYYPDFIYNVTSDSYAKITGGNFGDTNINGRLINNLGTADLINIEPKLYEVAVNKGILNIDGGIYSYSDRHALRIDSSAGTVNIKDATFTDTASSSPIINISSNGNLNIENSNLTSTNSIPIRLTGTGIANITSGTYKSDNSSAIAITGASTLNIGEKGGEVSTSNPNILGKTYGLYNTVESSTVNFYDGMISGQTAIYGGISSIEDENEIILETEGDIEHKYLGMLPVIKNINKATDNEYYSIQDAIDDASDGDTLEIMREYTTNPNMGTIVNNKNLTIDLKGFKIQQNNQVFMENNGTLNIIDSLDTAIIESNSNEIFINNGVLNISNGKYHQATSNDVLKNNEGGTLTIDVKEIYSTNTRLINNSGEMIINGGKIYTLSKPSSVYTEACIIENFSTGSLKVNGGEYKLDTQGSVIKNSGNLEVTDATVNLTDYTNFNGTYYPDFIYNVTSDSYAKITGGNFGDTNINGRLINNLGTADLINIEPKLYEVAVNKGILNIDGGIYSYSDRHALRIDSSAGTVNIKDATFTDTASSSPIINISSNGNLNIENSNLTSTNSIPIRLTGTGIANITSGTYKSDNSSAIAITGASTLNIGEKGGEVSTSNPNILGKTYGLYNTVESSTVNFYDGMISGQTAIYGGISSIEDENEIILETEGDIEHKYLGMLPVIKNINKATDNEYYSIQDAIDDASDGDTLEIMREYTTNPNMGTIVNNKNLIIDLKGFKIQQNNQVLFQNDGSLVLKTTEDGGMIESNSLSSIVNNGALTIESGKYHQVTSNYSIINNENATLIINGGVIYSYETRLIENAGDLIVNSGKIYTTRTDNNMASETNNLIENKETGRITLNGGEFIFIGKGSVINNYGIVESINPTVDLYGYTFGGYSSTIRPSIFIKNNTINSYAKLTGGTYGQTLKTGMLVKNAGITEIENVNSNLQLIAINTNSLSVTNGTYNTSSSTVNEDGAIISSAGTLTLSGITINESTSKPAVYVSNSSNLNITGDVNFNGYQSSIILTGTGIINVISGAVTSSNNSAINVSGASTLNIGELGGIPSTTNPVIYGKTYGIVNGNANATINFYDGVIKGESSSIYGTISGYEPGYKEDRSTVTDPDTGITTINSTLTVDGDYSRTIVVDNVNFTSLQTAVNYAVDNNISRIDLYNNIEITSDIVKPDGIDIDLYLNGFTITGDYNIDSGIHIINGNENHDNLGASVFRDNTNEENIVIYQLDDGSSLKTNIVYRLYKLVNSNFEVIKVEENNIGNYDIGRDTEEIYTTDGKVYINNISEGNYKLSGSDGSEINFEILSDGVSSNIRVNNRVIKNRIVTAVATLILQLQTGIIRIPYIIIILVLLSIIIGIIAIKKHKRI